MIILANAKRVLTIPTSFHDKHAYQIRRHIPQLEKGKLQKPHSFFNGNSLRSETRKGCPLLPLLFHFCHFYNSVLEILTGPYRKEK